MSTSDKPYVGWSGQPIPGGFDIALTRIRIPDAQVEGARKQFLNEGESLLAIVKGRAKTFSTQTDGFFNVREHATDKGGKFFNHYLIVTDKRVIVWARGAFKSSSDSFEYADITGIEQQQSGLFGTGWAGVVLDVHGKKANFAEMYKEDAVFVADMIRSQKQQPKKAHSANDSRTDNDPVAQIEKLASLLQKGLITRKEFEEKKKKLLAQI